MFSTGLVLAQIIRTECLPMAPGDTSPPGVTVNLTAINDGVSRARASAVFGVSVVLSWRTNQEFVMIDKRGYPVHQRLSWIVKWLEKSLAGVQSSLLINFDDAARLPARWTPTRINSLLYKLSAEHPTQIRLDAVAKRASVIGWDDVPRRAAVLAAADAMIEYADLLEEVQTAAGTPPVDPNPGGGGSTPGNGGLFGSGGKVSRGTGVQGVGGSAAAVTAAFNTPPDAESKFIMALSAANADGVFFWFVLNVKITSGTVNDLGAWFGAVYQGVGAVIANTLWQYLGYPDDRHETQMTAVVFTDLGVPVLEYREGEFFEPGVDAIGVFAKTTDGVILSMDRWGSGAAGAQAGLMCKLSIVEGFEPGVEYQYMRQTAAQAAAKEPGTMVTITTEFSQAKRENV